MEDARLASQARIASRTAAALAEEVERLESVKTESVSRVNAECSRVVSALKSRAHELVNNIEAVISEQQAGLKRELESLRQDPAYCANITVSLPLVFSLKLDFSDVVKTFVQGAEFGFALSPEVQTKLVKFSGSCVDVLDLVQLEISNSFQLSRETTNSASWCFLDPQTLLLTGGVNSSQCTVYDLDTRTITKGPSMLHSRNWHASVLYQDTVHVIGGYHNKPMVFCEKLNRARGQWEPIADLGYPRHVHGACVFSGLLYVAGGSASASVEVYDGTLFKTLSISTHIAGNASLVAVGDGVLVIAGNALHKLTPDHEEAERLGEIKPSGWWSPCPQVFIRREVFIVRDNKFIALDPVTRDTRTLIPIIP
jgi:hypothetical protein